MPSGSASPRLRRPNCLDLRCSMLGPLASSRRHADPHLGCQRFARPYHYFSQPRPGVSKHLFSPCLCSPWFPSLISAGRNLEAQSLPSASLRLHDTHVHPNTLLPRVQEQCSHPSCSDGRQDASSSRQLQGGRPMPLCAFPRFGCVSSFNKQMSFRA